MQKTYSPLKFGLIDSEHNFLEPWITYARKYLESH